MEFPNLFINSDRPNTVDDLYSRASKMLNATLEKKKKKRTDTKRKYLYVNI